ncbi:translation initiation factor IF-3 [Haliovirga abyssi]|uniref:translation initiation factor IF-3 n=1 Tax=Haliovirga abyssi TaxID=2996794 RepID=UPI0027DD52ED|nr:translation initiation factor IF-3 [Haliovirga abyssi]
MFEFLGRCFNISQDARINERITKKEVRLIGADGNQLGVVSTREALKIAQEAELDLVEISPNANPTVCKIMDYGKFKYEKGKREKDAKKNQKVIVVKEIKFKPRIDTHDLEVKSNKILKFLNKGNKVKVSLMLFGRERMHAEIGIKLLEKVAKQFEEIATVERKFGSKENQKFLILTPKK